MDLKKSKISPKLGNRQKLLLDNLKLFYKKDNMGILIPILNGNTKISLRIIDWFVTNYTKKNNIFLYRKRKKICPIINKSIKKKTSPKTKKVKFEEKEVSEQFNAYLKYKSQLKAYSKKNFDPFCRRDRINFYYDEDKHIVTTVGQLNFFRWAIEYNILDYIVSNIEIIEKDMNMNIKREEPTTLKKSKKTKKHIDKDNSLSQSNLQIIEELVEQPVYDNNNNNNIDSINTIIKRKRKKRRELSCSATNILNKHKLSITLEFE